MDIKNKSPEELEALCGDIRARILEVVSANGGHLAPSLGAVELIVAMHYVFDCPQDPFIFDVSHQSYAHKLLSGRWAEFASLRKFGGLSGYTKPSEGDYFVAGHSSTSISLAVGACKAINLRGQNRVPVVLIGDGALSGGMAYEALNELGDRKYPCVIILNDNEMSISSPVGAISKYISQMMAGQFYQGFKARVNALLEKMPDSAAYMAKRFEEGFRLITPGMLFEELGLEYIGPIDGHDLREVIATLRTAKSMKKPVIVHAQTLKGKGYAPAETQAQKWHGVSPFDLKSATALKKSAAKSATAIFSDLLLGLARKHENVVGVTAAMPSGTGLDKLMSEFPQRFWDVAIAEQHAVTSMAAMAREGFKPYIAIYSTFMQRAYDQIIHDCAIMGLPVVFCMDRAGIVGEDGSTHQGAFDISFLSAIPNLNLTAPRDEASFAKIMEFSYSFERPLAIRYPRGSFGDAGDFASGEINLGKGEILEGGDSDVAFIGYGTGVAKAWQTASNLNFKPALVDLVFAKPLDTELLSNLSSRYKKWFVFSDGAKIGGIAQMISAFLAERGIEGVRVVSFEFDDEFISHGATSEVEEALGLTPEQLAQKVISNLN